MSIERNAIFLDNNLKLRSDFSLTDKYYDNESIETFLEQFNESIAKKRKLFDCVSGRNNISSNIDNIFLSGSSINGTNIFNALDQIYIEHFVKNGIPLVLVTDENCNCDFIELVFSKIKRKWFYHFKCLNRFLGKDTKKCDLSERCGMEYDTYCDKIFSVTEENDNIFFNIREKFPVVKQTNLIPLFKCSVFLDFALLKRFFGNKLFDEKFKLIVETAIRNGQNDLNSLIEYNEHETKKSYASRFLNLFVSSDEEDDDK